MESHPSLNWPALPGYTHSLEILGRGLVLSAALFFVLAMMTYAFGKPGTRIESIAKSSFAIGCASILGAFGLMVWLVYNRQYQFEYVFAHSDNWLPDGKRLASLWGGQEGSFLLWAVMASLFGLFSVGKTQHYRRAYTIVFSGFVAGLAGILAYESPFKLWEAPAEMAKVAAGHMPPDGAGLTPALINYWMQIHPPTIFAGFGSLTVVFAFALAALFQGDMKAWTKLVRPWALVSASLMGLGLCMGGFWAYETLGWGGFWMWDPVENAALVPWLCMIAFIHGLFIQQARGRWLVTNAVLGALGLLSFMYGTFLTRSGFLGDTSVHSFASMDRSALNLLIVLGGVCLVVVFGASIVRWIWLRKEGLTRADDSTGIDRGTAYTGGIVLLLLLALSSALGMSMPLVMSLQGKKPSVVEEALYNRVTPWMFIPLVILMAIGPYLGWRKEPIKDLVGRISTSVALSLGFLGIGMFALRAVPTGMGPEWTQTVNMGFATMPTIPWILALSWICLFGIMANLVRLIEVLKKSPMTIGAFLSHVGLIVTMLGLIVSRGFEKKVEFLVQTNKPGVALGYQISTDGITGQNYMERENRVNVRLEGRGEVLKARPTLFYTENSNGGEPSPTVRPYIFHRPLHDLYLTIFPLVLDATEPTEFKIGAKRQFEGHTIQYMKLTREGQAGVAGTKFGAVLNVTDPNGHVFQVTPKVKIGDGRVEYERADVGEFVYELERMNAADQSATIKLYYRDPVIPMELYFKPLPGLVWWGTGLMFVGGLWAALHRRKNIRDADKKRPVEEPEPEPEDIKELVETR